jgi:tetratricopeptide (TPR) repeat protein
MRRVSGILLVFCLSFCWASPPAQAKAAKPGKPSSNLPVTTSSAQARELYEKAMADLENLQVERAGDGWRAATKSDPSFTLCWAMLAFHSRDPVEAKDALAKAKAVAVHATPGERLFVQWATGARENNYVAGIAAMNDLVARYPKDKRLLYLVGNWLLVQGSSEPSRRMLDRAAALDKNYAPVFNSLGYLNAYLQDFPKALEAMQRYAVLLPNEPNPQDSYAEIQRLAGNYEAALDHYFAALKIDPTFVSSQLGIGDTYALMGNQGRARTEYGKAIQQAPTDADRIDYSLQAAMTWVRENKNDEADKAFAAVAEKAHGQGLDLQEARAHRLQAMYQSGDALALQHLEQAEAALGHQQNIAQSDREEERARILRWRTVRAFHAGDHELTEKSRRDLEGLANGSRSQVIQRSYQAAVGAMLVAQEKYVDAVPHLQEDSDDPFSLELLSRAYSENGDMNEMHAVETKLRRINTPTLEQALVVVAARGKPPMHP